ncbi:hypothetical protein JHK87_057464 [Glycine soja]|nr:hypothetical protein JHK87_057464 [Glycine soja]
MSRAEELWERLVRAALRRERTGDDAYGQPVGGIAGNVPSALAKNRDIDEILRVADEIEDDDPNISRILCEHAYSLSQNLDPNSEGRGVLQFKTGLMSVIKSSIPMVVLLLCNGTAMKIAGILMLKSMANSSSWSGWLPLIYSLGVVGSRLGGGKVFWNASEILQMGDPDLGQRWTICPRLRVGPGPLDEFKTQKLAKREAGTIDRSQDIARLQEFYKSYREKHNVDKLREEEMKLRESGAFSRDLGELERKTVKRKRVFATLKVLGTVLEQLSEEIPDELKRVMDSDSALTEDLVAYNIIPLDASSSTNAIVYFPEVQAAVSALKYFNGLPELPRGYFLQPTRNANMFDFLQCTFGFQKDNVANQHEHIVHLLANEQSRLRIPEGAEPKLDEVAVQEIFLKSLQNYIKWCDYLGIQPVWSSLEAMAREMDEILRQQIAQPANSCTYDSKDGVSFLDNVIFPLYDIVSAEAANNDNGKAPHSSWRNYDDFNEYFWSLRCFELSWPWRKTSSFFQKPLPRSKGLGYDFERTDISLFGWKNMYDKEYWIGSEDNLNRMLISGSSRHQGKTSFVEHRTFFHLYHSFHRLWIFLFMMFQGLTILAFNDGKFNAKTLREILSLGPTFVVMKLFESVLDIFMMYGAYSTTRRLAVSRIFLRFLWFSLASVFITFLYVKALQEESKSNGNSVVFRLYVIVIGIYAGVQFFISFLMRIPACHRLTNQCGRWPLVHFVKWLRQERHYVGRGMYERSSDFIKTWVAYSLQCEQLMKETETPELERGAVRAVQDLYDVMRHDVLSINLRENYDTWSLLSKARDEGHLFEKLKWPKNTDLKMQVKRLYSLLTIKESASSIPKNLEARRRLQFFTNSLFMKMPRAKPVREMLSFSVFTPYYSEIVLYSMAELLKKNEDGISILFYLQKIYPDEWKNFLARIGRDENTLESELYDNPGDILELRFWASYRGQTLARTAFDDLYLVLEINYQFDKLAPIDQWTDSDFQGVDRLVGKGRDVGLNQIALFEGKVSGGNGEQVLSRDVYRLGQLFDFFRMLSFYFTTVGYYFCTMLTVLTVYAFLYGKAYLALSGVGEILEERARINKNTALSAALNTQFLFQIGIFTAVPMILGFILEQGFLKAIVSFVTMQFQLCTVFFTFSLGTRTHYFGRTILHGGARYQATGRGFVVRHIKFSENYRLYSRSHFVKGLEVALLLIVYLAYGYNEGGALSYILLSISSWFMALSWLFAPYLFNPSGFEWQKVVEDFRDWTNWLLYRGGIGVKGEESWEAWWEEELAHIRSLGSRIAETILSLRFFIFQYGIVYKLNVKGTSTSLTVYGLSWVVLAVLIILFKVFTFSQKISVNFQLLLRFIQGISLLVALAGLVVAVILTELSLPDIFASMLAFIPTGWGILSIAAAWKPVMKRFGLWKSVRSIARLYDAGMGMLIFVPIAFFSWFPFVSTFQTRLMFNQAFSRGLEISLILAGNNHNTGI